MKAITIKKQIQFVNMQMKVGELYIFNEAQLYHFVDALKRTGHLKNADIKPINDVIREFPCENINHIYIIRAGGIGDLIALSSLAAYIETELKIKVTIVTQPKYKELLSWFAHPISYHNWLKPIAINNMKFRINNRVAYLNYEGKIEKSHENWFHLFFEKFDVDFAKYGRPNLLLSAKRTTRITKKHNILLTLKATANVRTIEFSTVYKALEPIDRYKYIYVHSDNLSAADADFIASVNDKRIKIIKANSLHDFLMDVYSAEMVISTDTGALHFREGLSLPAIGLFNSFSAECRTKYYQYTKSFDIHSNCPYQPCFKHVNKHDETCKNYQGNKDIAPCFDAKINRGLIKQLSHIFFNNL